MVVQPGPGHATLDLRSLGHQSATGEMCESWNPRESVHRHRVVGTIRTRLFEAPEQKEHIANVRGPVRICTPQTVRSTTSNHACK
jgi:hypothetical protein